MAKIKSLVLLSGGLDSRLACKIMAEQTDVTAFMMLLPFGSGCCNQHCALKFSQGQQIKIKIVDATKGNLLQEYLNIVRHPRFGRGSALNPCIDCRIFLLKKAKEFADKNKIKIIATGEVLNERPMSQHKKALDIVEHEADLKGRLIRPLSAKLLPETEAEKSGLLDRSKFFEINGRNRKKQIELANKYKISFPSPAGGCLLCEKEFAKRFKPLLKQELDEADIQLLKLGRHFKDSRIILGKNQEENEKIEEIQKKYKKGFLIVPNEPGPSAFVKNKENIEEAKKLIQEYSKHKIRKFEVLE